MRDDFKQAVKDTLAERVGYFCSNPVQIPLRRSRLSGTVRATNPDKREPLTFET